ncbi:MAG: site-2 protease family protein [Anaerolineae bacterium]|jgi:Zn-dependent protease|nr:site-2 protease family protein [Chloroflexota bacterium]
MDETTSASTIHADLAWLSPLLAGRYAIDDISSGLADGRMLRLRGHLLQPASDVYADVAPVAAEHSRTLMMRRVGDQDVLLVLQWVPAIKPDRRWLVILLGVLTVISVLATYVLNYALEDWSWSALWAALVPGLQFTVALLAILLSHEMGHYLVARRFGVPVSLPWLIPFPLSPFGTMGAVIRMAGVPPNRRAMLLTGAAGPLAGLVACLPVLLAGLALSEVRNLPQTGSYVLEGNSLLYWALKYAIHGEWLPSATHDLFMHPLAFAGWAGLLVTGFNLIPAGQLDGGHIASAWLGARARILTWITVGLLLIMGFVWQGWFVWAILIVLVSRGQQEPCENITPLSHAEVGLAIAMLLLFVITFTPVPLRFIS